MKVAIYYSNSDIAIRDELMKRFTCGHYDVQEVLPGHSITDMISMAKVADVSVILLSSDFFSDEMSSKIYKYLCNKKYDETIALLVRSVILPNPFPFPIIPVDYKPMPDIGAEMDTWFTIVVSQLKLLLENKKLKQQIAAKDAELNLLRTRLNK